MAVVSAVIAIVGLVAGEVSKKNNAKAMNVAAEQANASAVSNAVSQFGDIGRNAGDVQAMSLQDALSNELAVIQAKGAVVAEAYSKGGGVIDSAMADIDQQSGRNLDIIITNRENQQFALTQQAEQIRQNAIGNQSLAPINQPAWLNTSIQIAGQAVQGYSASQANAGVLDQASSAGGV